MPKCDFNKVAKHDTFVCMANIYIIIKLQSNFIENKILGWLCNFTENNVSGWLLL